MRGRRALRSRGTSLIEITVVMLAGLIVLLALTPLLLSLYREQRSVTGSLLAGDAFPELYDRLNRDLMRAGSATLAQSEETGLTLTLDASPDASPSEPPRVSWNFLGGRVKRTEDRDSGPPAERSWSFSGSFSLLPEGIPKQRLTLLYQALFGEAEILVLPLPDSNLRPEP